MFTKVMTIGARIVGDHDWFLVVCEGGYVSLFGKAYTFGWLCDLLEEALDIVAHFACCVASLLHNIEIELV